MQTNTDLIKILEAKLAEARAGQVTDLVGVFGGAAGGVVIAMSDPNIIPALVGTLELVKPQIAAIHAQAMQQRARGIVPARGIVDQAAADALMRKLNGGA